MLLYVRAVGEVCFSDGNDEVVECNLTSLFGLPVDGCVCDTSGNRRDYGCGGGGSTSGGGGGGACGRLLLHL